MKLIVYIFTIITFSLFSLSVLSQEINEYIAGNFDFVGNKENINIYRYRDINNPINASHNSLYYSVLKQNNQVAFELYKQQDKDKRTIYIEDSLHVFVQNRYLTIKHKQNKFEFNFNDLRLNKNRGIAFDSKENILYLSIKITPEHYQLAKFNLNNNEKKLVLLPLLGFNPSIIDNYLYFSAYHICDWYSVYTEDVYRVKIGDWNNPELVLENVDPGNWFLIPESNVIYADILEEKGKGVLYNADTKSYKVIDAIYGDRVIKYEGQYYYEVKPNNSPITYKPVELPSAYPQKDDRVLCPDKKKRYFNLPNSQKPFTSTFITDELLYNTDEERLKQLDKKKLRLLRNAFYARQGYKFKSHDLQEFFGQFDWYNQLLKSYKVLEITNENIVISPKDKRRVDLILEIENSK